MASDSSNVDAAVVAALQADTGTGKLMALCPDGVFTDVAKEGAEKFVIVSVVTAEDEAAFQSTAYERILYLVKAVIKGSNSEDIKAAAQRIFEVLQGVTLSITGYDHMSTQRIERVRFTEVDDQDGSIRWQHRGHRFEVFVSPQEE